MKPGIKKHPAYMWGQFVRQKRLTQRITSREMSEHLKIAPSKYCEIENGILKWLEKKHELQLIFILCYPSLSESKIFNYKLKLAKKAKPLTCLGDIFKVTDMLPLWPLTKKNGKRMTAKEMLEMAKFVLKPLKE